MAYVLIGVLRRIAVPHTQIAAATCGISALSCSRSAPSSGSVFGASNGHAAVAMASTGTHAAAAMCSSAASMCRGLEMPTTVGPVCWVKQSN